MGEDNKRSSGSSPPVHTRPIHTRATGGSPPPVHTRVIFRALRVHTAKQSRSHMVVVPALVSSARSSDKLWNCMRFLPGKDFLWLVLLST